MLAAVDAWAVMQGPPVPTRPEAIRRALDTFFQGKGLLTGESEVDASKTGDV